MKQPRNQLTNEMLTVYVNNCFHHKHQTFKFTGIIDNIINSEEHPMSAFLYLIPRKVLLLAFV